MPSPAPAMPPSSFPPPPPPPPAILALDDFVGAQYPATATGLDGRGDLGLPTPLTAALGERTLAVAAPDDPVSAFALGRPPPPPPRARVVGAGGGAEEGFTCLSPEVAFIFVGLCAPPVAAFFAAPAAVGAVFVLAVTASFCFLGVPAFNSATAAAAAAASAAALALVASCPRPNTAVVEQDEHDPKAAVGAASAAAAAAVSRGGVDAGADGATTRVGTAGGAARGEAAALDKAPSTAVGEVSPPPATSTVGTAAGEDVRAGSKGVFRGVLTSSPEGEKEGHSMAGG